MDPVAQNKKTALTWSFKAALLQAAADSAIHKIRRNSVSIRKS
jgi:hypothetical protein